MGVEVKLVKNKEEYSSCLAIREDVFIKEQGVPRELEIDGYEESATHFLAVIDSRPAGCGRMRVKDRYIKFERIATLAENRQKGVGRTLVKAMEAHAKAMFPTLTPYLHAQLTSQVFYEHLGWKTVGETFTEAGIEHIAMIKPK